MVVKHFVPIEVKVLDHCLEVGWLQLTIAIFALVLAQGVRVDVARVVAIDPLEGCVGFEVAHGGQDLSEALNCNLLLRRVDKYFFHFLFRLVTEHLSTILSNV